MLRRNLAFALLGALTTAGCGITPDFDVIPVPPFAETFPSPERSLEGSVSGDGAVDKAGPLLVGDDAADRSWRGFTSFHLTVPEGGAVRSAVLRLHLGQVVGDPFGRLGLLFADRIDMGSSLDAADFAAPAFAQTIGVSSLPMDLSDFDVTALVQDALDRGLTRVDIRLRFGVSVVQDDVAQHLLLTSYWGDSDPVSLPPTLVLDWDRADTP